MKEDGLNYGDGHGVKREKHDNNEQPGEVKQPTSKISGQTSMS